MSGREKSDDTLVYSYESSVHSTSILLSLNDQRKQDLLCDVTLVVEDKAFRAHRSVLAACSDYFLSTVDWKKDSDLVINLPKEVTVKGFAPLLQFAYTAKLLLNKENVLDVCRCVEFLGIHNIEKTCFTFLQAKLHGNGKDHTEFPGKACCTSSCQKTNLKIPVGDNENSEADDDVEEFLESENLQSPCPKLRKCIEVGNICPTLQNKTSDVKHPCFKQSRWASLCPKYRKFQLACGKERVTSWGSTSSLQNAASQPFVSKERFEPCQSMTLLPETVTDDVRLTLKDNESKSLESDGGDMDQEKEDNEAKKQVDICCPLGQDVAEEKSARPSTASISGIGLSCSRRELYELPCMPCSQAEFIPISLQYETFQKNRTNCEETKAEIGDQPNISEKGAGDSERKSVIFSSCPEKQDNLISFSSGRSSVEREVAEHLAKGFWSELCGVEPSCEAVPFVKGKGCPASFHIERISECEQNSTERSQTLAVKSQNAFLPHCTSELSHLSGSSLSSSKCPFGYTAGSSACSSSSGLEELESDQGQQQDKCDDTCATNSGDEFRSDSEDDSESFSAREQECEVKLPFPVEKITLLTRYDFQTMLKMYHLNPEQLDYIHDIRRRSKNRIAAQRCRKRKLDCIQNLECEIHKLVCEKAKLLNEKDKLKVRMGETWENLSGLCKQMCKEAALSSEQIQTLAKYTSPECPLSVLNIQRSTACRNLVSSCPGYSSDAQSMEYSSVQGSSLQLQERIADTPCSQQEGTTISPSRTSECTLASEQCCQAVMTDFCQEMIDKCTTDE